MDVTRFSAIIPAAGVGVRAGLGKPKQWMDLAGEPMVVRVLRRFAGLPGLNKVALALHPEEYEERRAQVLSFGLDVELVFCPGGRRRQDSVAHALDALDVDEEEIIAVHDAARPFVSRELILSVVKRAGEGQAAIAAIPVTDTIKEVDRMEYVLNTPRRTYLRRAQTPQAVRAGILRRGLALAQQRDIELTDDAVAAELIGFRVAVVPGEESNIKITTPLDLEMARLQIERGVIHL
jgi:2-C-methyl-D-erythritol 4-phosphate cytidylyltransferase